MPIGRQLLEKQKWQLLFYDYNKLNIIPNSKIVNTFPNNGFPTSHPHLHKSLISNLLSFKSLVSIWFICNCVVVWLVRLHGVVYKFDKVASKTQPNPTQSECLGWCTWLGMIVVKSQSPRLGMTNDKLYLDRPILIPQTLVQFFRFSFHQH